MGDGVQDGGLEGLQLFQAVAGLLLLGHVHGVAQNRRPAVVGDGGDRFENPLDPAVAGDDPEFVRRKPLPLEHPDGVLPGLGAVHGMDDADGVHPQHLGLRVACVILDVGVHELELAVLHDVDAGLGTVGERLVEVFVEAGGAPGLLEGLDLLPRSAITIRSCSRDISAFGIAPPFRPVSTRCPPGP